MCQFDLESTLLNASTCLNFSIHRNHTFFTMNPYSDLFSAQRKHFQEQLKTAPVRTRIQKLRRLRKWILSHQSDIQEALAKDFKKPVHEVDLSEILPVTMEIGDAISHLPSWTRPRRVSTPIAMIGTRSKVHYEPKGVTLILAPWNFPFMLTISPLVSAIAAGCCAVVKPSEVTVHTTALIERMIGELFPEEEVKVITGDHHVAQHLTALPFDHIFFTGSPQVGKKVMAAAAENLASVTLELGGRNPVIVDASANIKDTARKLVWGEFFNAGQSCMSPNYTMIHEKIYDKLVAAIQEAYGKAFAKEQDLSKNPDYSHVVTPRHAERLRTLVRQSIDAGAQILTDPGLGAEAYLPPTILKDVQVAHPIMQEEIFGPVMPILKYKDLDDALHIIHSIEKPLGLYVFARSQKVIKKVLAETSSGNVVINDTTVAFLHPGLPFGGVNFSGIGKAHGYAGFMAFTNEKPVVRQSTLVPSTLLAHAPYKAWKTKLLNLVIRYF